MGLVEKCPSLNVPLPEEQVTKCGIRIVAVNSFDELDRYADAWNQLVCVPDGNPTFSHAWISVHLKTRLSSEDKWFCLLAFDEDRLVGVLPIVTPPRQWLGRFSGFRFETPYDELTTSAVEPQVAQGFEKRVCPAFHDYLWSIPCSCSCLRVRGLSEHRVEHAIDRKVFCRSRAIVDKSDPESLIRIQGDASQYFQTLSKKFHKNYCRILRRIEEQPEVQFRFEEGGGELQAERFMDIEHQGWKARRKTSLRSDSSYVAFFRLVVKQMEEQGWLRWAFLDIDGKTVAGQFMVQSGTTLYVVKIGYDESFSKLSPGTALFGRTIEWAFKSGQIEEINFISGYSWMKDWKVQMRDTVNVAFFPATASRWGLCKQPMQLRALLSRMPALRRAVDQLTNRLMHQPTS